MNIEHLKYPAGKLQIPSEITQNQIEHWIEEIAAFPEKVRKEVSDLSSKELQLHYREGGWNIKQVVNHCIDSHMNSIIRFKLALTENQPTIRPYREDKWAELSDTLEYNIQESLVLLTSIHNRWVFLLNSLTESDLEKEFIHPDGNETITLKENICIYAWHCNNHLGHIINAKKFKY